MESETTPLIKPTIITCKSCGTNVRVDETGFLVNHKKNRSRGGPLCDGSGRYFGFSLTERGGGEL